MVPPCFEIPYLTPLFYMGTVSENPLSPKINPFYIKKLGSSCTFGPLVLEISTWKYLMGINVKVDLPERKSLAIMSFMTSYDY